MPLLSLRAASWCTLPIAIGLWLRLSMIGGPPFTDGGTYQYNAWLAEHVGGSLPTAPLNAYSWLAALLGQPADTPFLRARLLDAGMLAAASAALTVLLRRCGARWFAAALLASTWAICWSTPFFSNCGFKHPIVAACLPMFAALLCLCSRRPRPLAAGILIAIACWLREAFAPMALLLPLVAWASHGPRAAWRTSAGGFIGGAGILGWMLLSGTSPSLALENLQAMSRNANGILEATGGVPSDIRSANLWLTLDQVQFVLWWPLVAISLLILNVLRSPRRIVRSWRSARIATLLALLAYPLAEIYGKFCLPYHWLQLLPAALVTGALAERALRARARLHGGVCRLMQPLAWVGFLVIAGCCTEPLRREIRAGFYWHSSHAAVMCEGDWTHQSTDSNRYLQVARFLREHASSDATLMVSGYAYALYPLSGLRPASVEVSDLTFSRMTGQSERHPEWLTALRDDPPDFVIETDRWPEPLASVWPDFDKRYRLTKAWTNEPNVLYGNFGMKIWQLR